MKLDSKLSWAKHITEITTKSSKVLGMVKRTLGPCKPEDKDTAYNMLVRPKLEYASPSWNPHTSSQINRLERIQHYAARFVTNDHRRTTSPTTLVPTLNWQTLERQRTIKQAMTFYKILNNIIEINPLQAYSHDHTTDNDINENIQSSIRLYADDIIIYRKINSNIDHQILQTDLIQLEKWSDKWQMQFNIKMCAPSHYKQN